MSESLLTLREAADLIGLPYSRVWEAARLGALASVRFSARGTYRVSKADLDVWLRAHRREARRAAEAPTMELAVLLPKVRRFS